MALTLGICTYGCLIMAMLYTYVGSPESGSLFIELFNWNIQAKKNFRE
jgi:hypothetical protein